MAKKFTSKQKQKFILYVISSLIFLIAVALATYIFVKVQTDKNNSSQYFEEKTENLEKHYNTIDKIQIPKDDKQKIVKPVKEVIEQKPKLAIIVDDVSYKAHVKKILDIDYKITMSFLPPTARHKNSALIAQDLPFAMVHLPLEAMSFKHAEEGTLKIDDSYETMVEKLKQIKTLYPNIQYINGHTGSKFTANKIAMDNLMKAFKQFDYKFLDSRTTAKSVAFEMAKKHNVPFISRNVFLDNKPNKEYIQNQLKQAIKIAKKEGQAVAICHPHSITLQTLKESKHLLDGIETVYANELW
jgi:polysaccharide deacetylase 2 family uncharacterized protein YibQ